MSSLDGIAVGPWTTGAHPPNPQTCSSCGPHSSATSSDEGDRVPSSVIPQAGISRQRSTSNDAEAPPERHRFTHRGATRRSVSPRSRHVTLRELATADTPKAGEFRNNLDVVCAAPRLRQHKSLTTAHPPSNR